MKNPKFGQTALPSIRSQLNPHQPVFFFGRGRRPDLRTSLVEELLVKSGVTTAEEVWSVLFSKGLQKLAQDLGLNPVDVADYLSLIRRITPKENIGDFVRVKMDRFPIVTLAYGEASNFQGPHDDADVPALPASTPPPMTDGFVSLIDRFMPQIRHQGERQTCVAFSASDIFQNPAHKGGDLSK